MRVPRFVWLLVAGVSISLLGQQPGLRPKPAWSWSSDERVASRVDAAARASRLEEHRRELAHRAAGNSGPQTFSGCNDVIDGDVHPELFFATELFDWLVRSSFVSLPKVYPLVVRQGAPEVFRTERDWQRFATIAAPYAAQMKRELELVQAREGATPAQLEQIRRELVTVRARRDEAMTRALRESRAQFGREAFDRVLYTVVARGRSMCVVDTIRNGGISDLRIKREKEDRSQ